LSPQVNGPHVELPHPPSPACASPVAESAERPESAPPEPPSNEAFPPAPSSEGSVPDPPPLSPVSWLVADVPQEARSTPVNKVTAKERRLSSIATPAVQWARPPEPA
jgi:hypothetical protein